MDDLSRRDALKLAAAGAAGLTTAAAAQADDPGKKGGDYSFDRADPCKSCRLLARVIAGTKAQAEVVGGLANDTYFLAVAGKKPYLNMKVFLSPLHYGRRPEYWEIEVVGCVPGIALDAIGVYAESLPLDRVTGTKGIEVVWAGGERERFEVPPKK